MHNHLRLLPAVLFLIFAGSFLAVPKSEATVKTFSYTGAYEDWVVPAGVTSLTVDGYGAAGTYAAAPGGRVQATLPVTPGETLRVYIGGQGTTTNRTGGFGGGGAGSAGGGTAYIGNGGGATDIRQNGTALANRIIVMGGGGGDGGGVYGLGGGTTGGTGIDYGGAGGGGGGTASAGGAGGNAGSGGNPGSAGSLGQGGEGANTSGVGGGGGGGGYYGGGGGGDTSTLNTAAGGGGGSSFTGAGVTGVTHTQGYSAATGNGALTFTYFAPPTITTPTNTSLHGSDATLGGNVTSDGGATVTDRGVCIGASADPAIGGTCFSTTGTTGVFTVSATSLTQGTLYHYRAYATNSVGTSYTTDDTFTTLALDNYLVTVVSPQTAGVCATGTNTVTARDSTNTTITTDSSVVNMTSSGSGVTFYTTNGCSSSTTQYTMSSGVANIYYKTNVAQSFTITATKNGSTETGTSGSITVDPGSQTRLVITLPSQTFTAGSGNSGSVTNQTAGSQFAITNIRATDDYFNVITGYTGAKTLAYSGPSSVAGAPSYTTSVSFTNGASTTTLNTTLYKAESTTITVTDGGLYGYASSSLTVDPGTQTRLVVTFPGQTFTAGSGNSGSVTNQTVNGQFIITSLTATDDYFNVVTGYSGAKTLAYAGPTATGGTSYTTAVSFTNGVSTTTLYTILTTAQTTTITVTDGGLYGYASSNLTVNATPPPKLLIKGGVIFKGR